MGIYQVQKKISCSLGKSEPWRAAKNTENNDNNDNKRKEKKKVLKVINKTKYLSIDQQLTDTLAVNLHEPFLA